MKGTETDESDRLGRAYASHRGVPLVKGTETRLPQRAHLGVVATEASPS